MKNKDLIELLLQLDPEFNVCVFHDIGPMLVDDYVELYQGLYEDPDNETTIFKRIEGTFIGIGNPSNYDDNKLKSNPLIRELLHV